MATYRAMREEFELYRHAVYVRAHEELRGELLNARGRAEAVDPYSLFMCSARLVGPMNRLLGSTAAPRPWTPTACSWGPRVGPNTSPPKRCASGGRSPIDRPSRSTRRSGGLDEEASSPCSPR